MFHLAEDYGNGFSGDGFLLLISGLYSFCFVGDGITETVTTRAITTTATLTTALFSSSTTSHSTTEHMSCPSVIPNGRIAYGCALVPGYTCGYICYSGCSPTLRSLFCHVNGSWGSENTACDCQHSITEHMSCPSTIPNGRIAYGCDLVPGYVCGYSCNSGCSPTFRSLFCHVNGSWGSENTACDCQGEMFTIRNRSSKCEFSSSLKSVH